MRHMIGSNLRDIIIQMSEGNPGALSVLMKLNEHDTGFLDILGLDDMNIRGSQIWVAYKDHCDENISGLIQCINNRDADMIQTVNKNSGIKEMAVERGASWEHAR